MGPGTRLPPALHASVTVFGDGFEACLMKGFHHQPKIKETPQMVLSLKMEFFLTVHVSINSQELEGLCV